jgi:hypothetical protein
MFLRRALAADWSGADEGLPGRVSYTGYQNDMVRCVGSITIAHWRFIVDGNSSKLGTHIFQLGDDPQTDLVMDAPHYRISDRRSQISKFGEVHY